MIYTIGHGNRTACDIEAMLREVGATTLVDVRRFPGSRRNPNLHRDELDRDMHALGIRYLWRGADLGGRRRPLASVSRHPAWRNESFRAYADHADTSAFRSGLDELRAMPGPVAFMCAETLWWQCHRRIIADALVAAGVPVVHLMAPGKRQAHALHPDARVVDGRPVYDRGRTLSLGLP